MTATTTDLNTPRTQGSKTAYGLAADEKTYSGGLVMQKTSDGYAYDGADSAGYYFAGIAEEGLDNTDGDDGDLNAIVWDEGIFLLTIASAAITDVGKAVYLKDNATVAFKSATTNDIFVGRIVKVHSSTRVWVRIFPMARVIQELAAGLDGFGASMIGIEDDGSVYTATDVEEALQELMETAIGGTDTATRAYAEENVVTADEDLFSSIDAIDLYLGDLASIVNGEGGALIGIEDAADHFAGATAEAVLAELGAKNVRVVVACPDVGAGGTDAALTADVKTLNGEALAKTAVFLLLVATTQYAGDQALSATSTFSAATKGSILGSGNGWAAVKADASGQFACTLTNTADETAYITGATVNGGVDAVANGVNVVECVPDDATWSA